MRIGVMLRDIWNQTDAPGIIVLNLIDKLLEIDRNNYYILFVRDRKFVNRYRGYPNADPVVLSAPTTFVWDQVVVPWEARRQNVDVIFHPKHSIPLLTGRRTVMHLRGAEYWRYPEHFEWHDILYQRLFLPMYCKKATRLIAESENVRQDFLRFLRIPESKISMIHLAPGDRFKRERDEASREHLRAKYNLPERFVLTVTRVLQNRKYYPGKNVLNLIAAFAASKAKKEMPLVIVGRKTKQFLETKVDASLRDGVVALGEVRQEELPGLYSLAQMFLFPSKYESFGIPILEAMACGCPVVTSNAFSCPEVGGEAAKIVDWRDVRAIAEAIDELAFEEQRRRDQVRKGYAQAERFSWERAARETLRVFDAISEERVACTV